VKKPLTAEAAESAKKKGPRILGVLCVLCGKTVQFYTPDLLPHSDNYAAH